MNRLKITMIAFLCLALAGCVEGETTLTVNPDGSAKIKIDVVSGMPINAFGFPDAKKKQQEEETLDDLIRRAIRPTLETAGVVAWKDVAAEILPNGKLKFSGTAYVKQLEEFNPLGGVQFYAPNCSVKRDPAGALVLASKKSKNNDSMAPPRRTPKTPDEIRKMTDEELDKYILRDLIEIQSFKPLLSAFFSDAKIKTIFVMPGDVTAVAGFAKDGNKATMTLDGNKTLDNLNKFLTQNPAARRKLYREAMTTLNAYESLLFELGDPESGSITVAKPGKALFDFDQEVKEAQAAYPQLRKKFGFGDDLRLPTSNIAPKK